MSGYIAPGAPSKLDRSQIASLHGGAPSKFWKAEPTTIPQPSPQPASNPNPYSKAYHGSGNFTRHSDVFTRNAPPSTSSSQISLRRRRPSGSSLHLSAGTRPSGATSETLRRPFDALVDGDELDPLNMGAFEQSRSSRSALDKGKQKASPEDEDEVMLVESSAVSAPPTHSRKRKSGDEDYPFLDMLSVMKTRSDRKKAEQAKMKEIRTAAIANEKPLDKFRFNPRSSPAPAPPASRPVSSRPDLLPIRILFWGLIKHEANSSPDVPKVLSWPQNHPAFSLRQAHSPAPGQKPLIVVPMKCVRHFEYFSGSSQIPPYLHFDIEIDTDNKPTSTSDLFKSDSDTFRPRQKHMPYLSRSDEHLSSFAIEVHGNSTMPQQICRDMVHNMVNRFVKNRIKATRLGEHEARSLKSNRENLDAKYRGGQREHKTPRKSARVASPAEELPTSVAGLLSPQDEEVVSPDDKEKPRTRSSARLSQRQEPPRKVLPPLENPNELILVYPPTGKGAIEITAGDYRRLEPDEYFNDTLIEFGMKRAFHRMQETNPTLAEQVHLFNSFFYGKLSSKLPSDGYQSVRKWTSKFNFFDKNYIVIPINENFHWYLCIIYNPKNSLPPQTPPPKPVATPKKVTRASLAAQQSDQPEATPPARPRPRPIKKPVTGQEQLKTLEVIDLEADDNMDIDASTVTENSPCPLISDLPPQPFPESELKTGSRLQFPDEPPASALPETQESVVEVIEEDQPMPSEKQRSVPCLLFFLDSLGSVSPRVPRKVLVNYLLNEAIDKKLVGSEWDARELEKWFRDHVVSKVAKVPQQPNFCDCGAYLVHFVEIFLSDPVNAVEYMALRNQPKSADESVWNKLGLDRKRITMKEEIDRLAVEWKETSGSRTENSALDDETPVELHDSVVLPPDNAGARESLQISRLSSPDTSGQQSSVREDENTVAKLLSPHLSSLVDLDCVSLGPNSPDISMDSVSNEIEPPYSRAMSVEIGVPPCEPHVQRALSKAQFSKYASREAEADLKTDSEAGDTGTDPLCSTSSLQVEPPQSQVQEVHETPVYVLDSDEEENGAESVTRAITTSKAKSAIMSSGTEDTAASLPPPHRPRSTLTVEIPASRRAGRGIVSEDEDKVGVRELEIQQIGATRKHKPLRFSPPAST